MSGVYLIVWEDSTSVRLLNPTKGGYPHITVAYTGKNLAIDELKKSAGGIMNKTVMEPVTLTKAYVNSFTLEKTGRDRHDVLLSVSEEDEKLVEDARDLLRERFPTQHSKFYMRDPHVTAKICETREEAEEYAAFMNEKLPLVVTITGVTID